MTDVEGTVSGSVGEVLVNDAVKTYTFTIDPAALVDKARKLIELLDDMEKNHGGLVGTATYRGRDDLRQELSKWPK